MLSAARERVVQLAKLCEQDETTSDSIALLKAEFAFAEKSFLELSRQATAFQDCLREATALLKALAIEHDQLFSQDMLAGQLADDVPIRESSWFYANN